MHVGHFILGRCNPDRAVGPNRVVFELARCQARAGLQVTVYAIPRPGVTEPRTERERVRYVFYPRTRMRIFLNRSLRKTLQSNKDRLDIAHLHGTFVPELARIGAALRTCNVPYVVSAHGSLNPHALRLKAWKKRPYFSLIERKLLRHAAAVHLFSKAEQGYLHRLGLRVRSFVIPNGVTPIPDLDAELPNALEVLVPAARGTAKLLFLGRLSPSHKGLDLLIPAFAEALKSLGPNAATLFLVGPAERRTAITLRRLAERLGIEQRVVFLDAIYGEHKLRILQGCDLFVHTSRFEGMPMAVLEAVACGKPCLVTPETNLGEFIADYRAGRVVRPIAQDIAAGLVGLIRDRREWPEMGRNAKRLASEQLNWEIIAAKMAKEYVGISRLTS